MHLQTIPFNKNRGAQSSMRSIAHSLSGQDSLSFITIKTRCALAQPYFSSHAPSLPALNGIAFCFVESCDVDKAPPTICEAGSRSTLTACMTACANDSLCCHFFYILFVRSINFIPILLQRERTQVTTPRCDARSVRYKSCHTKDTRRCRCSGERAKFFTLLRQHGLAARNLRLQAHK